VIELGLTLVVRQRNREQIAAIANDALCCFCVLAKKGSAILGITRPMAFRAVAF
jgi:hypothetical protein